MPPECRTLYSVIDGCVFYYGFIAWHVVTIRSTWRRHYSVCTSHVTIIRNRVLEQLVICVLPCCCLVEQFIDFTSARIVPYAFCAAANLLQVVSEVGYFGCALTKNNIVHREQLAGVLNGCTQAPLSHGTSNLDLNHDWNPDYH